MTQTFGDALLLLVSTVTYTIISAYIFTAVIYTLLVGPVPTFWQFLQG